MKKSHLLGAVCAGVVTLLASVTADASTYSINRTVGGGTLSGTITTDNTIGALLSTNITAWDLDIVISPSTANLTNLNSAFSTFGAVTGIIATAGELLFDASSSVDGGFGFQEGPPITPRRGCSAAVARPYAHQHQPHHLWSP